jgi:hypothetical protein
LHQQKTANNNFNFYKMKVTTSNPVIMGGKMVSGNGYSCAEGMNYVETPEDTYQEGDFQIQTSYPVIVDDKNLSPSEYYLNLTDAELAAQKTPPMKTQVDAKKKGLFWDKVKGGWQKISSSPAAQFALQQVAAYAAQNSGAPTASGQQQQEVVNTDETTAKKPMSTGLKVGLIIGGIAVVGLIIYSMTSKGGKSSN